jgi:hypothetical protein
MMLLKILNRIANLVLASSIVRLLGFVADAACLGALIAWIGGVSFRYLGMALCIDVILFCIHGLIGESLKRNGYILTRIAAELEEKKETTN